MTEPSPLPTPEPSAVAAEVPEGTRPGDMMLVWRLTLMLGWIAAFFAYAAVWQASVQLGIATWWVGPRSQPQPAYIRLIPFVVAVALVLLIVYNVRGIARISAIAAGLSILIALPDFSRSVGLAVVEVIISVSMLLLSAVAFTGRYRAAPATPVELPPPPPAAPAPPASDAPAGVDAH